MYFMVFDVYLGESNISLHEAIVSRVNTIYRATIKNMTHINDNLATAQGVIEVIVCCVCVCLEHKWIIYNISALKSPAISCCMCAKSVGKYAICSHACCMWTLVPLNDLCVVLHFPQSV